MKKLPQHLLNELQKLNSIQPNADWKQETQAQLLEQLTLQSDVNSLTLTEKAQRIFQLGSFALRSKTVLRPVGAFVAIAAVIIGPGLATVSAARASLPGDALYTFKRGIEQVQVNLTFSEKKKTELQIQFVSNRLDELQRLTHEEAPSQNREEKITIALEELKKDTNSVQAQLKVVEAVDEAVLLAKIIEEKTSKYKDALQSSVSNLSEGEPQSEQLQLALSTVQEAALGALDVLVKKQKESANTSESNTEDLTNRVSNQLDSVQKLFAVVKRRLAQLEVTQAALTLSKTKGTEESSESNQVTSSDYEPFHESLDAIEEEVTYAQELLDQGDFTEALAAVSKTKTALDKLLKDISVASKQAKQEQVEQDEKMIEETEKDQTERKETEGATVDIEEKDVTNEEQQDSTDSGDKQV